MKNLILLILFSGLSSLYSQSIESQFYGTWTCSFKSNNGEVKNNVVWTFKEAGKGQFMNYSDSSNKNGITCTTKLPFEWAVNKRNQIFIVNGQADCTCLSAFDQSKSVLENISQSIIDAQSNENLIYDFSFKSEKTMIMGGYKMKKN